MKKIIEYLDSPSLKERSLPYKLLVIYLGSCILLMLSAVAALIYDKFIA